MVMRFVKQMFSSSHVLPWTPCLVNISYTEGSESTATKIHLDTIECPTQYCLMTA